MGRAAGTLYRACQRPTRSEKAAAFFPGKREKKKVTPWCCSHPAGRTFHDYAREHQLLLLVKLNVPTLRAPRSARACVRAFAFAFALALALALARPGRCRSACLPPAPIILLAVRSASYSFCQRAPPFLLFCCCCFHKARMRMNSSIDCQYVRESFAGTTARQKQEQF